MFIRLQNRLGEMTDRHRRLLKYTYKKDDKLPKFEAEYPVIIEGKTDITAKFSTL